MSFQQQPRHPGQNHPSVELQKVSGVKLCPGDSQVDETRTGFQHPGSQSGSGQEGGETKTRGPLQISVV